MTGIPGHPGNRSPGIHTLIALAAKKAIPISRKTQYAWWCHEVEQAVTPRRQAQYDHQAHPDDDDNAETFQMASARPRKPLKKPELASGKSSSQIAETI